MFKHSHKASNPSPVGPGHNYDMDVSTPPKPPESPIRAAPKLKFVTTYLGAKYCGDVLLCLPKDVRARIFSLLLDMDEIEFRYIEVPNLTDFRYPYHITFSDLWYTETCEAMIKNATFSLSTNQSIINFLLFLNEFQDCEGYDNVTRLEFTDLHMLEKGDFASNATKLLRLCSNVKHISVNINIKDLRWTRQRGGTELCLDSMTRIYDFAALITPKMIESITLELQPFMAMQKKLAALEEERELVLQSGCILSGLDSFWGLEDWLVYIGIEQMKLVEVHCPSLSDSFGL